MMVFDDAMMGNSANQMFCFGISKSFIYIVCLLIEELYSEATCRIS